MFVGPTVRTNADEHFRPKIFFNTFLLHFPQLLWDDYYNKNVVWLYHFLLHLWHFDSIFGVIFIHFAFGFGRIVLFDEKVVFKSKHLAA